MPGSVPAQEHLRAALASRGELLWLNNRYLPFADVRAVTELTVSDTDIRDAQARFARFAPFFAKAFPETAETGGQIRSPLREIDAMRGLLLPKGADFPGRLFLKMDSHLPVAGSIKARGGIYEVLCRAESLALEHGLISPDSDYALFASDRMKRFFSGYSLQVGSTGNLGLSVGIAGAAFGFHTTVHMSADAKAWKKALLREKGVEVIEYAGDYQAAVAEGRRKSLCDPKSYFVDDEYSRTLFLGYAAASAEIAGQFESLGMIPDENHPLFVYLPCGVGGGPGGVAYGLKRLWGDRVHCFFAEPVEYPSMLLGMATERHQEANVREIGLGGPTCADGLACASPSGFVSRLCRNLISGIATACDASMLSDMALLKQAEGIRIEPSGCAAFSACRALLTSAAGADYLARLGIGKEQLSGSVHLCWATGGRLVPPEEWERLFSRRDKPSS